MIKRKKFLCALICVILSVCTFACVAFSGCAEYTPPQTPAPEPSIPESPSNPETPSNPEEEQGFSVQLIVNNNKLWQNFTKDFYEASDGNGGVHEAGWVNWANIKVQWIDVQTGERFIAPINEQGKAVYADLDGDFKVTLTSVPTGFTYEPNLHSADNITKGIEITLYKIQTPGSKLTLWNGYDHTEYAGVRRINSTGAYRVTLSSNQDRMMFAFSAGKQGTYSFTTLVDVSQNKINPKLSLYRGNLASKAIYYWQDKDDGGAENTYTKNVSWQYYLAASEASGNNAFIFELYSSSIDGNASYPLVVDFLIQRDGDYTKDTYTTTPVEVTEDFTKTPAKPSGTFTWAARNPATEGLLLDSSKVILNTEKGRENKTVLMGEQATENDGYYYFYSYDQATKTYTLTDRLYAAVNTANEIVDFTNPLMNFRYLQGHDYREFVKTYKAYCNSEGAYPVNEELALFLQRYSLEQRLFNDGYGLAETTEVDGGYYASDEDSMWMFACGYYKK